MLTRQLIGQRVPARRIAKDVVVTFPKRFELMVSVMVEPGVGADQSLV